MADQSAIERLRVKFDQLKADGLQDMKVHFDPSPGVTLEELAEELLAIIDCYEREDFVDITKTIDDGLKD